MKKQVLFIHGGGEGAYEEDKKMAAGLRDALGAVYEVRAPHPAHPARVGLLDPHEQQDARGAGKNT